MNVYSQQQYIRPCPQPHQHLSMFLVATVTETRWNLTAPQLCIFLMAKNVKHFPCTYWPFAGLILRNTCSVHLLSCYTYQFPSKGQLKKTPFHALGCLVTLLVASTVLKLLIVFCLLCLLLLLFPQLLESFSGSPCLCLSWSVSSVLSSSSFRVLGLKVFDSLSFYFINMSDSYLVSFFNRWESSFPSSVRGAAFKLFKLFYVWRWFACIYVCAPWLCTVPAETRIWHRAPRNWS